MAIFREIGHKGNTKVMQEVAYNDSLYLIDGDGTIYEKKSGLPVVEDEDTIKAVKKAAE
jgi:hypothetical protein